MGSAGRNAFQTRAAQAERTREPPPRPDEVQVKYRLGLPENQSPARQEAILKAHRLIEDLKVLYTKLWVVPEASVPRVLSRMNGRAASALDPQAYQHAALMELINTVALGAEVLDRLPVVANRLGLGAVEPPPLPVVAKHMLSAYRGQYPKYGAMLDAEALEIAIRAFGHRVGRAKPTSNTKWKAMKALAAKAGIWTPAPESLKRQWARRRQQRRTRARVRATASGKSRP